MSRNGEVSQLYAWSQDARWLKTVEEMSASLAAPAKTILSPGPYEITVDTLPKPQADALFLLDATGAQDIIEMVAQLRARGWRYVVVVAADPSWKEARDVLGSAGAHDYWAKTYVPQILLSQVKKISMELCSQVSEGPSANRNGLGCVCMQYNHTTGISEEQKKRA